MPAILAESFECPIKIMFVRSIPMENTYVILGGIATLIIDQSIVEKGSFS
jgi:hypothetical protein